MVWGRCPASWQMCSQQRYSGSACITAPRTAAVGIVVHLHLLIGGVFPDLVGGDAGYSPRSWARPMMDWPIMASMASGTGS